MIFQTRIIHHLWQKLRIQPIHCLSNLRSTFRKLLSHQRFVWYHWRIHTLVIQSLDSELPAAPQLFHTIEESLTYLWSKILPDGCQNNTRPCVRRSNGQTGINNGGLSRQFFTDLFLAASAGANGILALLKGWNGQTLIAYDPTNNI